MYWYKSLSYNKYLILVFFLFIRLFAPAQMVINEIAALNASGAYDPDFGEFADYIELYNTGEVTVNLKGYTLTDNPGNQQKWSLPELSLQAGEFLLIWADGRNKVAGDTAFCSFRQTNITTTALHANFAFSGDGEYACLFDPQGMLVDEIYFGVQQHDVFYGRNREEISAWQYFGVASPGTANPPFGARKPVFSGEAICSLNSGFYQGSQRLILSAPVAGGQVRYTTDGSTPEHTSPLFSDTLIIDRTSTIKARVFEADKIPGPVITRSYLINENIQLPVISISANSEHFHDYDFGLLRNALKEREIPVVLEYFDQEQKPGFTMNAGIRLFGSTIYQLPQRPLSIRFKAKYGESELVYPLFENRENQRYTSFLLRNGGNDHDLAYFRDGLAMNLAKQQMDIDLQDYQPCVVFINGEYQGIYELRERLDEDHLAKQHQLNSESIDLLEDSLLVAAGHQYNYRQLIRFVEENDLSLEENYAYIQSKIDVNEYTNYLIHKIFIGYWLFDLNNRYWRPQSDSGRWRWIAADMEHAFGQLGGDQYDENTLAKVSGTEGNLPEWSTLLFRKLLENNQFRDEFIQRFAAYLNELYQPENTLPKVDSLQALLEAQMPRHIYKWKTPVNMNVWKGNIQFIREYLQNRPTHLRSHIAQQFGLTDSAKVTLRIEGKGKVAMAGVWHQNDSSNGYFFKGAALSLLAVPEHGHRFAGWDEQLKSAN
ncbi:MAG: CotH kinase family protein, partial [Prolixibacteraceae bacterium]|nr:CotH kinase family protein [Prolixibacteraceae bacterium]